MADKVSKAQRSSMMSKVRGKNTEPEMAIRSALFKKGFRFRVHVKKLPGCPDIVLSKYKAIIFVNGCFWHGHSCKAGKLPKTNVKFWEDKINGNIKRDMEAKSRLESLGWKVLTLWECMVKGPKVKNLDNLTDQILKWIISKEGSKEIP